MFLFVWKSVLISFIQKVNGYTNNGLAASESILGKEWSVKNRRNGKKIASVLEHFCTKYTGIIIFITLFDDSICYD